MSGYQNWFDRQTKTRVAVITALVFINNIQIWKTGCLLHIIPTVFALL